VMQPNIKTVNCGGCGVLLAKSSRRDLRCPECGATSGGPPSLTPLESAADAVISVWDKDSPKDDPAWFGELETAIESLRAARKGGG
jgi:hypothetical protein